MCVHFLSNEPGHPDKNETRLRVILAADIVLTRLVLGQSFGVFFRAKERAREDARDEADVMDSSIGVGSREEGVFDNGDSKQENGGGAGSEEGLAPEAIRSKTMRVASMDALRKKIQVLGVV